MVRIHLPAPVLRDYQCGGGETANAQSSNIVQVILPSLNTQMIAFSTSQENIPELKVRFLP